MFLAQYDAVYGVVYGAVWCRVLFCHSFTNLEKKQDGWHDCLLRLWLFNIIWLVRLPVRSLLPSSYLHTRSHTHTHRLTIGCLLITKLPLETILTRMVSYLSREAAVDKSTFYLLRSCLNCVVGSFWSEEGDRTTSDSTSTNTNTTNPTNTNSTTNPNTTTTSTLPRTKHTPLAGSAILLAVLLTSIVESATLAIALFCPLMLDLCEGTVHSALRNTLSLHR